MILYIRVILSSACLQFASSLTQTEVAVEYSFELVSTDIRIPMIIPIHVADWRCSPDNLSSALLDLSAMLRSVLVTLWVQYAHNIGDILTSQLLSIARL